METKLLYFSLSVFFFFFHSLFFLLTSGQETQIKRRQQQFFHPLLSAMLSDLLSSSRLTDSTTLSCTSLLDATTCERSAPLLRLLQLLPALLSHHHQDINLSAAVVASSAIRTTHDALYSCVLCRLTQLLCHWVASRVVLPERADDRLLVWWMSRRGVLRGRCGASAGGADSCVVDSNDGDSPFAKGVASVCNPMGTLTGCTAACFLPADSIDDALVEQENKKLDGSALHGSAVHSMQRRDAALQQQIDSLFQSLRSIDRGGKTEGREKETESLFTDSTWATENFGSLVQLYQRLKHDDTYLFRPAPLSPEHVAQLLQVYATSATELAALTILHFVAPSSPLPSSEAKCDFVCDAFRRLLHAQQAARAALRIFDAAACERLLRTSIRPLIEGLTSMGALPTSVTPFLHAHVEPSADPLHSVSGCGLVATSAIHEGELLLQEESLVALPSSAVSGSCRNEAGAYTESMTDVLEHVLPDVDEVEETCATELLESSTLSRMKDTQTATERVVSLFACRSLPFAQSWWWVRWALALFGTRRPACAPASASAAPQCRSMRVVVKEAVLAACNHDVGSTRSGLQNSAMQTSAGPSPSFSLRPLLFVREADELHMPRLPFINSLLPQLNSDTTDCALFCLLRLVNHACTPNAMVVYDTATGSSSGMQASLVALRDIEEGEEITISYVPATTALTVSQAELAGVLGFVCRCTLCTEKAALLHGVVCGECGQLVWAPSKANASSAPSATQEKAHTSKCGATTSAFYHAAHCSRCRQRRLSRRSDNSDAGEATGDSVASPLVEQLRRQLYRISLLASTTPLADSLVKQQDSAAPQPRDPLVAVVRQLVDLDDSVSHALLPTHHLRLRIRLEAFAYAAVARGLGSTVSAELIHLCACTIGELEVLLGANHPLLTGLRMYLVFSRGRHVRAVQAAKAMAQGTRHADCCGAVRKEAALMELPFVLDPLVRHCVTRCFQEHYVQLLGWKLPALPDVTEEKVLRSFLSRYPVELRAAGVTTAAHMEFLACMEDSESEAT